MINKKNRGQTTLEYVLIIIIFLGAFIAMSAYVKRGFSGRWKSAIDNLGEQYDPRVADSSIRHQLSSTTDTDIIVIDDTVANLTYTSRTDTTSSVERKTGNIVIGSY